MSLHLLPLVIPLAFCVSIKGTLISTTCGGPSMSALCSMVQWLSIMTEVKVIKVDFIFLFDQNHNIQVQYNACYSCTSYMSEHSACSILHHLFQCSIIYVSPLLHKQSKIRQCHIKWMLPSWREQLWWQLDFLSPQSFELAYSWCRTKYLRAVSLCMPCSLPSVFTLHLFIFQIVTLLRRLLWYEVKTEPIINSSNYHKYCFIIRNSASPHDAFSLELYCVGVFKLNWIIVSWIWMFSGIGITICHIWFFIYLTMTSYWVNTS